VAGASAAAGPRSASGASAGSAAAVGAGAGRRSSTSTGWLAGRVGLASWNRYLNLGRLATLRLWINACTEAELISDAQLALAAGWVFLYQGDRNRALRCVAAAETGDLEEAEEAFRKDADASPGEALPLYNLGTVLGMEGRHEEAVERLAEAAKRPREREQPLPGMG